MSKKVIGGFDCNAIVAFAQNCAKEFENHHLNRLTALREKQLIKLAQNGNEKAVNLVFLHNYKYILNLTYLWQGNNHINQHEVLSACIDGLLKSINTYDTTSCQFNTYAIKRMKTEIRHITAYLGNAITFNDTAYYRIKQVDKYLSKGMSITEIANAMKISTKQVKVFAQYSFTAINENIMADDTEYVEINEMYDHLEYLIENHLDKFSRSIIRKYFGLRCPKMTFTEIAQHFNTNCSKIQRTFYNAMEVLKKLA